MSCELIVKNKYIENWITIPLAGVESSSQWEMTTDSLESLYDKINEGFIPFNDLILQSINNDGNIRFGELVDDDQIKLLNGRIKKVFKGVVKDNNIFNEKFGFDKIILTTKSNTCDALSINNDLKILVLSCNFETVDGETVFDIDSVLDNTVLERFLISMSKVSGDPIKWIQDNILEKFQLTYINYFIQDTTDSEQTLKYLFDKYKLSCKIYTKNTDLFYSKTRSDNKGGIRSLDVSDIDISYDELKYGYLIQKIGNNNKLESFFYLGQINDANLDNNKYLLKLGQDGTPVSIVVLGSEEFPSISESDIIKRLHFEGTKYISKTKIFVDLSRYSQSPIRNENKIELFNELYIGDVYENGDSQYLVMDRDSDFILLKCIKSSNSKKEGKYKLIKISDEINSFDKNKTGLNFYIYKPLESDESTRYATEISNSNNLIDENIIEYILNKRLFKGGDVVYINNNKYNIIILGNKVKINIDNNVVDLIYYKDKIEKIYLSSYTSDQEIYHINFSTIENIKFSDIENSDIFLKKKLNNGLDFIRVNNSSEDQKFSALQGSRDMIGYHEFSGEIEIGDIILYNNFYYRVLDYNENGYVCMLHTSNNKNNIINIPINESGIKKFTNNEDKRFLLNVKIVSKSVNDILDSQNKFEEALFDELTNRGINVFFVDENSEILKNKSKLQIAVTDGKSIYINYNAVKRRSNGVLDVYVHEFLHIFLGILRLENPSAYFSLLKGSSEEDIIYLEEKFVNEIVLNFLDKTNENENVQSESLIDYIIQLVFNKSINVNIAKNKTKKTSLKELFSNNISFFLNYLDDMVQEKLNAASDFSLVSMDAMNDIIYKCD